MAENTGILTKDHAKDDTLKECLKNEECKETTEICIEKPKNDKKDPTSHELNDIVANKNTELVQNEKNIDNSDTKMAEETKLKNGTEIQNKKNCEVEITKETQINKDTKVQNNPDIRNEAGLLDQNLIKKNLGMITVENDPADILNNYFKNTNDNIKTKPKNTENPNDAITSNSLQIEPENPQDPENAEDKINITNEEHIMSEIIKDRINLILDPPNQNNPAVPKVPKKKKNKKDKTKLKIKVNKETTSVKDKSKEKKKKLDKLQKSKDKTDQTKNVEKKKNKVSSYKWVCFKPYEISECNYLKEFEKACKDKVINRQKLGLNPDKNVLLKNGSDSLLNKRKPETDEPLDDFSGKPPQGLNSGKRFQDIVESMHHRLMKFGRLDDDVTTIKRKNHNNFDFYVQDEFIDDPRDTGQDMEHFETKIDDYFMVKGNLSSFMKSEFYTGRVSEMKTRKVENKKVQKIHSQIPKSILNAATNMSNLNRESLVESTKKKNVVKAMIEEKKNAFRKVEDKEAPIGDKEVVIEDKEIAIQDKEVVIEGKEVVIEGNEIAIQDTEVAIQGKEVVVEGKGVVVEDKGENTGMDIENNVIKELEKTRILKMNFIKKNS